jgi:hypothetical protein
MDTKVTKKLHNKPIEKLSGGNNDSFDFEQWAVQVRHQLIAALQKSSE